MTSQEYVDYEAKIEKELNGLPDELIHEAKVRFGTFVFTERKINFGIMDKANQLHPMDKEALDSKLSEICEELTERYTSMMNTIDSYDYDEDCSLDWEKEGEEIEQE